MQKRGSLTIIGLSALLVIAVLFLAYFLLQQMAFPEENISTKLFYNLIVIFLLMLAMAGNYYFFRPSARLRKKLETVRKAVSEETIETLKEHYKEIYRLYLKLTEKEKQNFYAGVEKIRAVIEEHLLHEKKMEELSSSASKGRIKERKKSYDELYNHYQHLPAKTKQKHYPKIVQIREELERGKKE